MRPWTLVAFLGGFMAINFMDKAVFGLAALPIMAELRLSPGQFGAIGSSFFVLFSISAVVVGRLGDRFEARWLLAAMAVLWSIAQAPMAGAVGVALLIGCRVLLGAAEGPAAPTTLHAAYSRFSEKSRRLVTGVILSGAPLGVALASIGCTWIITHFGWHAAFGALAALSLLWVAAWLPLARRGRQSASAADDKPVSSPISLRDIASAPTMIGVMVASFASYAASAVAVIWLPAFLQRAAHFSASDAGWLLAAGWWLQIPGSLLIGWLAEALNRKEPLRGAASGIVGTLGLAVTGAAFVSLSFALPAQFIAALVFVGLVASLAMFIVAPPLVAEIIPPARRSSALGLVVGVSTLAGLAGPFAVGRIVDASAIQSIGYQHAFLSLGAVMIASAVCAHFLIRPSADRARLVIGQSA